MAKLMADGEHDLLLLSASPTYAVAFCSSLLAAAPHPRMNSPCG